MKKLLSLLLLPAVLIGCGKEAEVPAEKSAAPAVQSAPGPTAEQMVNSFINIGIELTMTNLNTK